MESYAKLHPRVENQIDETYHAVEQIKEMLNSAVIGLRFEQARQVMTDALANNETLYNSFSTTLSEMMFKEGGVQDQVQCNTLAQLVLEVLFPQEDAESEMDSDTDVKDE